MVMSLTPRPWAAAVMRSRPSASSCARSQLSRSSVARFPDIAISVSTDDGGKRRVLCGRLGRVAIEHRHVALFGVVRKRAAPRRHNGVPVADEETGMLTKGRLDIVVGRALGTVLMTVRGPLRGATVPRLGKTVEKVLGERPERVVIDLTGVTDLDDDGLAALRQAKVSAEAHQVQLVLTSRAKAALAAFADEAHRFTVV
jgi:anti-anti-sigma regulatory factor